MRPLPVEFVGGAPEFVSGLSIVRGAYAHHLFGDVE